ncbi:hypothetical protein [Flavobacterium hungaricum]|uniref:Uncharacterized protein n=1 Tax=Flavobacterium hungaricum TaxID=2082725 RepID=A0ABR9TFF5_9FLAO|nr:hypothetical protein [Flavobacterium hungaricum]MBE8723985.1 hypothetical protein [Flavobacterium hungaricum]
MSTNTLKVTKEWLDQFHEKNIEYITTIDNRELFTAVFNGEFPGNQFNYETVFKIIEAFISSYHFIKIDYIRLIWSEKLTENNLQFLKNGEDYSLWKEKILAYNFEIDTTHFPDIEDSTDIFCNYSIDVDGEERTLYQSINDRIAIHLFFNEIKKQYSIFYYNGV